MRPDPGPALRGRRALVTGASAGIGLATARRLARGGAEVVMLDQREDVRTAAEAVSAADPEAGPSTRALPWVADLSRPEEVAGLFARVEERTGPVDILVNNAGVGLQATILDAAPADLRFVFEVNFFAVATLCREALRAMAARGDGTIINVSSAAARRGLPGLSAYAASKHAVHGFTQSLRQEALPLGVFVSEVLPISVRTHFFDTAPNRSRRPYAPRGWTQTPEQVAEIIAGCLRRPRPEVCTSFLTHLALALGAAFPGLADRLLARRYLRTTNDQRPTTDDE